VGLVAPPGCSAKAAKATVRAVGHTDAMGPGIAKEVEWQHFKAKYQKGRDLAKSVSCGC